MGIFSIFLMQQVVSILNPDCIAFKMLGDSYWEVRIITWRRIVNLYSHSSPPPALTKKTPHEVSFCVKKVKCLSGLFFRLQK